MGSYEKAPNVEIMVRDNKTLIINKETGAKRKYTKTKERTIVAAFQELPRGTKKLAEKLQVQEDFIEKLLQPLVEDGFLVNIDLLD